MPLVDFICPDGVKIPTGTCLAEGGCRVNDRCATRSYLRLVAQERPWTGKPSTTQLIQGTMQAFLKLTKDYSVSPDARAFMLHGTKAHKFLEESDDDRSVLEEAFRGDNVDITGISDSLEAELNKVILSDYKTSGSYKVAKALGFTKEKEDTGEVYKTGPRKGQPKLRDIIVRKDEAIDRWEWELQLNKYRIEAEKKLASIFAKKGIDIKGKTKIDELKIQCCVRDGNTYIARSRGVFRSIYYFRIPILPDKEILFYFHKKKLALGYAMKAGKWTLYCTEQENWNGLKCSKYCEVAEYCPLGQMYKQEKEEKDMPIKGVSDIKRLPRIGKIRLGITVQAAGGKEHPKEVDYFIPDPQTPVEEENKRIEEEFFKLYGKEAKKINIMFPVGDRSIIFPQWYKRYGKGTALKCKGDGETAFCTQKEFTEGLKIIEACSDKTTYRVECKGKDCIYAEGRRCSMNGALQVLLPEIPGAGVWQISTGSFNSIVNLNGCIDYIKSLCGRVHMVPLTLERRKQSITKDGKARNHYILHINMNVSIKELQQYALIKPEQIMLELPAPETDKKDILFQQNENIEEADVKTSPTMSKEHDIQHKISLDIATDLSDKLQKTESTEEVNKIVKESQKHKDTLMQEHKEWLNDMVMSARQRITEPV